MNLSKNNMLQKPKPNSPNPFFTKRNIALFIGGFVVFLYVLPFIVNYEHSYIIIHDNWDTNYLMVKILVESGKIFADNSIIIENALNGLPRFVYPSSWGILVLLDFFFPTFTAYLINYILLHFTAYFGMYLLLRKYFLQKSSVLLSVGIATSYAILPFWTPGSLSVAGLPLALYCFLNIKNGISKWYDWVLIVILPFFTNFMVSFVFFLTLMGIFWIIDWIRLKKPNRNFFIAIVFMILIFCFIENRLIISMFFSDYQSHRESFQSPDYTFIECIKNTFSLLIFGHYHSPSFQYLSIGFSTILAIGIILKNMYLRYKNKNKILNFDSMEKTIIIGLLLIAFFSLIFGFWNFTPFNLLKSKISLLRMFNFTRFYFLFPLVWYIVFSQNLHIILTEFRDFKHEIKIKTKIVVSNIQIRNVTKHIPTFLILIQILFLFTQNIGFNSNLLDASLHPPQRFDEYFAEAQFREISSTIGQDFDEYRVGCIGFHPSIANYNGFYTIDGYYPNYPLEYKIKFQYLIQNELNKNEIIQNYYESGASRCYIMSAELGIDFVWTKDSNMVINNLQLNTTALDDLNCDYILSSVEITNFDENNLNFISLFVDEHSIWDIYLYAVK